VFLISDASSFMVSYDDCGWDLGMRLMCCVDWRGFEDGWGAFCLVELFEGGGALAVGIGREVD
jgi:hypothetical protein